MRTLTVVMLTLVLAGCTFSRQRINDPKIGMKYYQEIAPGVAMDRAEVVSLTATLKIPAGAFENCLKTQEGSALKLREKEFKIYASGIGLLKDGDMLLTEHGFIEKE